jgi:hypothetical protein
MLTQYLAEQLSQQMDDLFEENKWGEEKIQE